MLFVNESFAEMMFERGRCSSFFKVRGGCN